MAILQRSRSRVSKEKMTPISFCFSCFLSFLFSQAPLNGFSRMLCTCVSLNIWAPALLKDLPGLFFVTEAGLIIFPLRLCVIREMDPSDCHRGQSSSPSLARIDPTTEWEAGVSSNCNHDVATCDFRFEPLFKTHGGKPWPSSVSVC